MTMRVSFVNLWNGFDVNTSFFTRILRKIDPSCKIDLGIDPSVNYDLVFSIMVPIPGSKFYADMSKVDGKKLCFTGESYDILKTTPCCDAYIGFDHAEEMPKDLQYLRFPLYALYHYDHMFRYGCSSYEELKSKFFVDKPLPKYSAVVSNSSNVLRTDVIKILCSMGLCDSGGAVSNNVGNIGWSFDAKMNLTAGRKYGIAFENKMKRGYITEKIYECMMVGAVPFYWGAPDITEEFNPKAYHIFDSSSNDAANKSLQRMVDLLSENGSFEEMRAVDPFTGFASEKYIRNGDVMFEEFILNLLEKK